MFLIKIRKALKIKSALVVFDAGSHSNCVTGSQAKKWTGQINNKTGLQLVSMVSVHIAWKTFIGNFSN